MGRKTTLWISQATNKQSLTRENLDIAKKGNLQREIEYHLIVAENNAIKTNYENARIDKTQQNRRKLRQKESRNDWLGKVIHWEL